MKSILKWAGIVFGGLAGLAILVSLALYPIGMEKLNRSFPDIPVDTVSLPSDPAAVARGKHIAVVWACTKCHGDQLSGTLVADDPIKGTIPAPNLTPGKGGKPYTDADWVRAIRHGVKPDGRAEILMCDYSTMSDPDLSALIAYLKQIAPVNSDYTARRLGPIVPLAAAIGLVAPAAERIDHAASRPADPEPGATIEYGRYLSVLCTGCHGERLAGKLAKWKREDFVRAVRTGVLPSGKKIGRAMPLKTYGEMNDTELDALWLYFTQAQR